MTTEQVLALVRKLNRALELQQGIQRIKFEFAAVLSQSEDVINLGPMRVTQFDTDEETEEEAIWQINDELNEIKESVEAASNAVGKLIDNLNKQKRVPICANQKEGHVKPKFMANKVKSTLAMLLLAVTFLYVDKNVAALQFDIDNATDLQLDSSIQDKVLHSGIVNGKTRVLIYGLNATTFKGRFAGVNGPVASITGVVGATPEATDAGAAVKAITATTNMRITK